MGSPSRVFSLRLSAAAITALRRTARRRGLGPTALARAWLLERLADEPPAASRRAREAAPPYHAAAPGEAIADACRARGVRRLSVFGSAAVGGFDPSASDVDLAVEFQAMPPAVHSACYFGLIEDLERTLGRSVDLIEVRALANPYIRDEIARTEVLVYEAT